VCSSVNLNKANDADNVTSINHSQLSVVFTTRDHVETLIKLAPKVPSMKMIVCIDDLQPDVKKVLVEWAKSAGGIDLQEFRDSACHLLISGIPATNSGSS
jgi:long-chain acyl-CoA synthetase